MKRIDITNGIMRIDTNTETFDIQKIQNRRLCIIRRQAR